MTKIFKLNKEKIFYTTLALASFILIWQYVTTFTSAKNTTPQPLEVFKLLFKSMKDPIGPYTIWGHLAVSLRRVLIGFSMGSITGIICGISMGTFRYIRAIVKPIFEMLRPIPPIAWIPLAILWFGIGETTKYFIIFISAFTNVTLNSFTAAINIDPRLIGAAKMLGTTEREIFTRVILPTCTPQIFAGMQVGLSTSWMAVLAAEMVRSSEGLGWIIIRGSDTANIAQVLVGMIVIGGVGLLLASIMRNIERRLCSWNIMDL
ncbi:MAG: ABC transporter permease [Lachnospirales bacterium]